MESPGLYADGNLDGDEVVSCKGCGEIIEEGKAFELAGQRWHLECFRCNTCGTLLDSDANLLLLGDGSLICSNCTYSCNACGNKIEDLAILTGDQAFCSACFRCRNCKKKIENLRYARTSQGIFCMSCHESLMARRRKRTKPPKASQNGSAQVKEKALPSLPPGAATQNAFSDETPSTDVTPGASGTRSPPDRQLLTRKDLFSKDHRSDSSPISQDSRREESGFPGAASGDRRPSAVSQVSEDDGGGFLPMAFDPTPVAPPANARKPVARENDQPASSSQRQSGETRAQPDYFGRLHAKAATSLDDDRSHSRSPDCEHDKTHSRQSPHILYQDKSRSRKRDLAGHNTPPITSASASPSVTGQPGKSKPVSTGNGGVVPARPEPFQLQEVPRSRKASSRRSTKAESETPQTTFSGATPHAIQAAVEKAATDSPSLSSHSPGSSINPFDDPKRREGAAQPIMPPSRHADRPVRGDSLNSAAQKTLQHTLPDNLTSSTPRPAQTSSSDRRDSTSSMSTDPLSNASRNNASPQPQLRTSFDAPPPRSSSRPLASAKSPVSEEFVTPRAAPAPQVSGDQQKWNGISTPTKRLSPALGSAGLPRKGETGFSFEEMGRVLRGDHLKKDKQAGEGAASVVKRRGSNAVKHGRSFSDRGLSSAGKSPVGSANLGSPVAASSSMTASPNGKETYDDLVVQLRRARQHITELEAQYGALETKVNSSTEIKAATNELREKRDTIVVLDTQRELVVRELEAMTEHLSKARDSSRPLDLNATKSDLLRDFAISLQKLKDDMSAEIEDLMHKRRLLTEEISKLIQMKDKGCQEYESLSAKNAQLLEMNQSIMNNIKEMYKTNRTPNGAPNGLGSQNAKPETPCHSEVRNLNVLTTDPVMSSLYHETEAEPATVLTAPQVVNIRKGQPKKFNWRKGGERMAKNVTKGIKGAFAGQREGEPGYVIGMPYQQAHHVITALPSNDQSMLNSRQGSESSKAGAGLVGGFFGQKHAAGGSRPGGLGSNKNFSSSNLVPSTPIDASVLFGSELEIRCEYEKRVIPAIVSRCIEEVESRGMDVEGIYRKSGGSGQVKTVQMGFEKDGNYDISDEELDIHAVTSTLKQYFRKLPTPLITFDVYESLLEAGRFADKEKQADALRAAVAELPDHHRDCLELLVNHLARVVAHESTNLMTPLNLSVVFAPTIMRPTSIEREMSDMQAQRTAVQALLDQRAAVFVED